MEGIIARKLTKKKFFDKKDEKKNIGKGIKGKEKTLKKMGSGKLKTIEAQKLLQKIKENKVHLLTQGYLKNFNSLKSTFSAVPPPSFYTSISQHIEENFKFYKKEFNTELTEDEKKYGHARLRRFRDIFKNSIDFEKYVVEFEDKETEIKNCKDKIKETQKEEMRILREKGSIQEQIYKIEKSQMEE